MKDIPYLLFHPWYSSKYKSLKIQFLINRFNKPVFNYRFKRKVVNTISSVNKLDQKKIPASILRILNPIPVRITVTGIEKAN